MLQTHVVFYCEGDGAGADLDWLWQRRENQQRMPWKSWTGDTSRANRIMLAALGEAKANDEVARKIYALRTKAGLTQRELANLVGTTASVICLLEDADYKGHSLGMLRRIAAALDRRLEIRFVPIRH